jgi:hypothetical protein
MMYRTKMNGLFLLLIAALFTVPVLGQKADHPDLTGNWTLDMKKSDPPMAKLYKGKLKKGERFGSRLEIEHKDPAIKLTETFVAEELDSNKSVIATRPFGRISTIYYTNGKGETNKLDGKHDWVSSTSWKGDTIVVVRPEPSGVPQQDILEFSLAKDGSELRIREKTVQLILGRENEVSSAGGKSVYMKYQPEHQVDK